MLIPNTSPHQTQRLVALDNKVLAPSGEQQQLVESCIPGTLDKRVHQVGMWCVTSRDPNDEHTDVIARFPMASLGPHHCSIMVGSEK